MTEADPAGPVDATSSGRGEMPLRVISSLVLAPLAVITAYWGGWVLAAFWTVAAILVFWEWTGLVMKGDRYAVRAAGIVSIAVLVMLVTPAGYVAVDLRANLV